MFGAIYIGLSGLNAYSRGLAQVSNNVTNLNTSGFRGSTVTFQNFYGSGSRGGLSYTAGSQGSGNGVGLGDTRLDFSPGELRQSDRDLDLAVDGGGFLVLLDGANTLYARTGSFEVDADGFIVLASTDYRLATLDASGRPVSLSIEGSRTSPPEKTTRIKFAENLSASSTTYSISDLTIYDAAGGAHVWNVKFDRDTTTDGNAWKVSVTDDKGTAINDGGAPPIAAQALKFLADGRIDTNTSVLTFKGANGVTVALDFSQNVTSFSSGTVQSLRSASIDGHGVGTIMTASVNAKGELELGFSNEQRSVLGAVALADFRDPQSLEQRSGGLFAYEGTSGREYLSSEDPRVGRVMSKRIEASNVDLSQQFGDLILIQRGFQASSQIVSVSNDMIQQLFGIRGQG
jgi:flagellar hook protein FlgE